MVAERKKVGKQTKGNQMKKSKDALKRIETAKKLYCSIYDKACVVERTSGFLGTTETALFDALRNYILELEPDNNDIVFNFRGF